MQSAFIKYVYLKNFAAIYAGTRKKELTIDMKDNTNKIILIIGPNGSGKTAILSNLHLFAYPGSMDIRNGDSIIIKGETGYKEIHVELGGELYIVKHHYHPTKEGHSVKSFISKNWEELNPNGNVTSFKEIILLLTGLTTDYMKLLRLGSNVTNFIDMKSTDRKSFTTELSSDIDFYTQSYKKINEDTRYLRSLLRMVCDKLDKLHVFDKKELISHDKHLHDQLKIANERKTELDKLIWAKKTKLSTLISDDPKEFVESIKIEEAELDELNDEIRMLNIKRQECIVKDRGTLVNRLAETESSISSKISMKNFLSLQLSSLLSTKDDKEMSLKALTSGLDYSNMQDLYLDFHRRKEKLDPIYAKFTPKCTKEDILTALRLFQNIDTIIGNIQEFDADMVCRTTELKRRNLSISKEVKDQLYRKDLQIQELNLDNIKVRSDYSSGVIYSVPSGCKPKECPYYQSYKRPSKEEAPVDIERRIVILERKKEDIQSMLNIESMIDSIFMLMDMEKTLLSRLPVGVLDRDDLLTYISRGALVYDESKFTSYIQLLEEYEEYKELKSKIKELKVEITYMEKNKTTIDILIKEFSELDEKIFSIEKEIKAISEELVELNCIKTDLENDIVKDTECSRITTLLEQLGSQKIDKENQILYLETLRERCQFLLTSIPIHERDLADIMKTIKGIEDSITENKFKIMEFEKLTEEQSVLTEKFDEMEMLKESLSSTKGLPLLFMKLYMEDIKVRVNDLLNIVYKGDLEINDFIINDKEFNIPYTKRGMTISDVVMASQGEKSFISIALSFALMKQSLDKYNVLLLDEIDATLDTRNRHLFIDILERQMHSIESQQCFMITHNNMFDNYPVSVIMTAPTDIDNFSNVDIINIT